MVYKGAIIEESLEDKTALNNLTITKLKVERVTSHHKTPWIRQWTIIWFSIPERSAQRIARRFSKYIDRRHRGAWYINFSNKKFQYIVFRDRVFKVRYSDGVDGFKPAVRYGLRIGIPQHQLDFTPAVKRWVAQTLE